MDWINADGQFDVLYPCKKANCDNQGMAKRRKVVMETCKMCLAEGVRLQDSHFVHKGIYRALRIGTPHGNSNPVMMTSHGAVQTSKQVWVHLLCSR